MTTTTTDLAIAAPTVTSDQLDLIKRTVANGATDAELKLFLFDCARRGVHPLDKLLHFTKRGGKYTPVTSIDFMRAQAAMSGEMAGNEDAVFHDTEPGDDNFHASVTVYRLTDRQRFPYTATARWEEYCPPAGQDHMWQKMPHTMLGKCAEALALRKAFPQQLAGLYAKEELDQADRAIVPPASASRVDTATGEEVPTSERPPAPSGYRYIDDYHHENGWHHVEFHDPTRKHAGEHYKTKLVKFGAMLARAHRDGVPVVLDITPNSKKGEPGWVNGVELYEAPIDVNAQEAARSEFDDPAA